MTMTAGEVMVPGNNSGVGPRVTASVEAIDHHIGARIRLMRNERNVSMRWLADEIGVSVAQVVKYEQARNKLSPGKLHAIALALRVPPGWFFEGFGPIEASGVGYDALPSVPDGPLSVQGGRGRPNAHVIELAERISELPTEQRRAVREMVRQFSTANAVAQVATGDAAKADAEA